MSYNIDWLKKLRFKKVQAEQMRELKMFIIIEIQKRMSNFTLPKPVLKINKQLPEIPSINPKSTIDQIIESKPKGNEMYKIVSIIKKAFKHNCLLPSQIVDYESNPIKYEIIK